MLVIDVTGPSLTGVKRCPETRVPVTLRVVRRGVNWPNAGPGEFLLQDPVFRFGGRPRPPSATHMSLRAAINHRGECGTVRTARWGRAEAVSGRCARPRCEASVRRYCRNPPSFHPSPADAISVAPVRSRTCSEAAPQTAETKPVSRGAPSLHPPSSQPRYAGARNLVRPAPPKLASVGKIAASEDF